MPPQQEIQDVSSQSLQPVIFNPFRIIKNIITFIPVLFLNIFLLILNGLRELISLVYNIVKIIRKIIGGY